MYSIHVYMYYTDYGSKTCAGYPGSGDHLEQDVQVRNIISSRAACR